MKDPLLYTENSWDILRLMAIATIMMTLVAMLCKYFPSIPEPRWRFKSPIGRLPFFDGIILYGIVATIGLALMRFIYLVL